MSSDNNRLKNILTQMIGATYLYKTIQQKVNAFRILDDQILISTNVGLIGLQIENAEFVINHDFLPIDSSDIQTTTTPAALTKLNDIKIIDTLQENIQKLKTEPAYIKQAMAINNTINTMLNIVKTELQIKRVK